MLAEDGFIGLCDHFSKNEQACFERSLNSYGLLAAKKEDITLNVEQAIGLRKSNFLARDSWVDRAIARGCDFLSSDWARESDLEQAVIQGDRKYMAYILESVR